MTPEPGTNLADVLDRVMEKLIFAPAPTGPRCHLERFPNSVFDDIDLMEMGHSDRGFFTDVTPEVIWPVNHSTALFKDEHLLLTLLRSATGREMRGHAKIFPKYMAWFYHAHFNDDGTTWKERIPVGFIGGVWKPLDLGMIISVGGNGRATRMDDAVRLAEIRDTCMFSLSAELTNRYDWSVAFRIDTSPSLRICTDPSGIKALFRDRDKGNRSRRSALRHWVSEHYRRHRVDPEAEAFVREHLRGVERFRWCGYDCEVHVSPYDLERAEWAKECRPSPVS